MTSGIVPFCRVNGVASHCRRRHFGWRIVAPRSHTQRLSKAEECWLFFYVLYGDRHTEVVALHASLRRGEGTYSGRCLEKATLSRIAQNSGSNLTSLEEFLSGVLNVRCGQMLEFVLEGLPNCRCMDSTKPVRQASPACS